jgi:hypothetical protein
MCAFWLLKFYEKSTNCSVNNKAKIINNEEAKEKLKLGKQRKLKTQKTAEIA